MYCLCNKVISSKSRFGSASFQLGKWFVPGAIFNRVVKFAVTLFSARFKQYNSVVIALINYYEPDLVTSLEKQNNFSLNCADEIFPGRLKVFIAVDNSPFQNNPHWSIGLRVTGHRF